MKIHYLFILRALSFALTAAHFYPAFAEVSLTLDDIQTRKGKLRLSATYSYANINEKDVTAEQTLIVQTGPSSFVAIPAGIRAAHVNRDIQVASIGFRYGLTKDTEIYTRGSYIWRASRSSSDLHSTTANTNSHFLDAWIGANHRILKNQGTPSLLGFLEVAVAERDKGKDSHAKSWLIGATAYEIIDPIVLSFTAAYRRNSERNNSFETRKPGDILFVNPSLAFAVNDRITLSGGLKWINRQADRRNGIEKGIRLTTTDIQLGMAYGFSKTTTVNLTVGASASGYGSSTISVNFVHSLGQLFI